MREIDFSIAKIYLALGLGGESGIRTHGELPPTAVFKTAALNHSAISPRVTLTSECASLLNGGDLCKPRDDSDENSYDGGFTKGPDCGTVARCGG